MMSSHKKVLNEMLRSMNLQTKMNSNKILRRLMSTQAFQPPEEFKLKRALILSKVTRYEYEHLLHRELTEDSLHRLLRKRGSDPDLMKKHHRVHELAETRIVQALETRGVETKICKRGNYVDELVEWSDLVISAGGDGTFLMAASKILNPNKPLVGFNTDPTRSEGYLCLPKYGDFERDIDHITKGAFYWYLRKRLRITMIGNKDKISESAMELHKQTLQYPEYRYVDLLNEPSPQHFKNHPLLKIEDYTNGITGKNLGKRILPVLSLNEVYVGESLSSRVSYLEVKLDSGDFFKTRNSGLCISTGTGSTSWTFNINKLTQQSVQSLLKIVREFTQCKVPLDEDKELIQSVTQTFNDRIVFNPSECKMAYTLRDPVHVPGTSFEGVPETRPRGHAQRMEVKSRCFDAHLVVDGSLSFRFNDGTKAVMEILDEDALRTIQLKEPVDGRNVTQRLF